MWIKLKDGGYLNFALIKRGTYGFTEEIKTEYVLETTSKTGRSSAWIKADDMLTISIPMDDSNNTKKVLKAYLAQLEQLMTGEIQMLDFSDDDAVIV